ncbi:hypothetical protein PF010_g21438 [Phytophthora fragariae]|uniref:Secreted protein n=1 Tax=Phytophthora fragariae TaxID=53985 RepID=A0A6A3GC37_9STRA|nr:hypothetical protein PF011_g32107 [Phytophthora fragariae]KAE9082827.1 hypothetical protein PF010_g21438 [Phytophthora fragariae]KAE9108459.1 hypothetical protein PF006_g20879 [Phytophthora fragariae]KAE9161245.1 hypothetical protein PF004_g30898 [Phytophthora fragariae]
MAAGRLLAVWPLQVGCMAELRLWAVWPLGDCWLYGRRRLAVWPNCTPGRLGALLRQPGAHDLFAYSSVSLVVSVAKCLSDCGTYSTKCGTRLTRSLCGTPVYVRAV